jgi:hypothetical protein
MLIADKTTKVVTHGELELIPAPLPTDTWCPIPHHKVLSMALESLDMMRFEVKSMNLVVAKGGHEFFGTLDIAAELADGVRLSVGIRNATNKAFSAAVCSGERVLVCSNLAFVGEHTFSHKHTLNVERKLYVGMLEAVKALREYRETSAARIAALQSRALGEDQANSLILRSYEKGIVGARMLKPLIDEWRTPSYTEFESRNAWSLMNAFTHVMKERQGQQPIQSAAETMAFQHMLAV